MMFKRSVLFGLALLTSMASAGAGEFKKPITKPKYDPSAEKVELFDGIESKSLDVVMRPQNEFVGNVFIKNNTDKPITVVLPDAVVGIQVHPQFGGGGMGGGGMGGGFFSIPAAETVKVQMNSVCLEHGKKNPTARSTYRLVPVEQFSDKPELKVLCSAIGTGKLDRNVAQAAAWHLSSNMSWDQLASKMFDRAAAADVPYFTRDQLVAAHQLVQGAQARAKELAAQTQETPASTVETRSPGNSN